MDISRSRQSEGCQHPGWKAYWERIYAERNPDEVSWYQAHPQHSLSLITDSGLGTAARIIDVGGGASTLVDYLLSAGYRNLAVLDISAMAIERTRQRLDDRAGLVNWYEGDVTNFCPAQPFDIWHDRAVFHFLTHPHDRTCYVDTLRSTIRPNGQAIIATFSDSGPSQCSGLEVVRYSPASLARALGPEFHLVETLTEEHRTPDGGTQQFVYCRFIRDSKPARSLPQG